MNKNLLSPGAIGASLLALILLSGCATAPPPNPNDPPSGTTGSSTAGAGGTAPGAQPAQPPQPVKRPGELALAEGVDLYNQGNFAAAIRKLQEAPEIASETQTIRIEALKYTAFAACSVPGRAAVCRQSFDRILELDANFELTAAEKDHPGWGPVFRQAKQARATRRPAR
jgi:hypothetical protein